MQIATWNVNSIRSRKEHAVNWLQKNEIDILCLQETKVVEPDFPRKPFEEIGYHTYVSGQKSYNGVSLFSREPLEDVSMGFAPIVGEELAGDFDEQKRVITGVIGDLRVLNLYVPNGSSVGSEKYEYKLGWFEVLKTYVKTLLEEGREMLICGDFNIALEERDIYAPKKENHIMYSVPEKETLQEVLALGEFGDVFRKVNQEEDQFSWWDYRTRAFNTNRGWRIDHIYLTPKSYTAAKNCWIDREPRGWEKPSDHTPVIVEL